MYSLYQLFFASCTYVVDAGSQFSLFVCPFPSPPCGAGVSILCCDKTGTLTLNKMAIQDETLIYKEVRAVPI